MDKYLQQTNKEEVKFWISHNLKNYLKNNTENVSDVEHIIDYLNSSEAPSRLRKMSYEDASRLARQWVARMVDKGMEVVETEVDTEVVKEFDGGFKLVKLVGQNAFKREGSLMSHCVASYYGKSDVEVYSLRDNKNNPHCTMEVQGKGNINQIKGKGNGSIHPKYINYVIESLRHFGMKVRGSELTNLGYMEVSPVLLDVVKKHYKNPKTLTFDGSLFLYTSEQLRG